MYTFSYHDVVIVLSLLCGAVAVAIWYRASRADTDKLHTLRMQILQATEDANVDSYRTLRRETLLAAVLCSAVVVAIMVVVSYGILTSTPYMMTFVTSMAVVQLCTLFKGWWKLLAVLLSDSTEKSQRRLNVSTSN